MDKDLLGIVRGTFKDDYPQFVAQLKGDFAKQLTIAIDGKMANPETLFTDGSVELVKATAGGSGVAAITTGIDATAFAFIAAALCPIFTGTVRGAAERHDNLRAYVGRMAARYYPERSEMAGCVATA